MNRTDRLLALILELRDHGWVQAQTLARTFGVSTRTVYRDILALNEAHVPVVSVPGRGYTLMPGYFLPPLHFTAPEATLLALGLEAMRGAFDPEYQQASASAGQKLRLALPGARREEVEHLRAHLHVVPLEDAPVSGALVTLRGAMLRHHAVSFTYHKPGADSQTEPQSRRVYPLTLVHLYGTWLLGAFDPARGATRTFRLSRMEDVRMLPEPFHRDPAWSVAPDAGQERRDVTVRVRFPAERRRAVQERPSYFQVAASDLPGGHEVTLRVRDARDVLPWALSWGADALVLEPPELRALVQAEARRLLTQLLT